MKPRITVITLCVDGLENSLKFYRAGLGLPIQWIIGKEFEHGAVAFFEQRKVALETRDKLASETGRRITTAIEPYSGFYLAEDYHQKHSLRSYPEIMAEFRAMFPDIKSMLNSTAVTRVNGYLGGNGSCDSLKKEIESFGLSLRAKETLTFAVCGRKASISCPMP